MAGFGKGGASIRFIPPLKVAFAKLGFDPAIQEKIFRYSTRSVAAFALGSIQKAFKYTQAQPGGSAWVGVSQAWAEKKMALGKSAQIGTFKAKLGLSFSGPAKPLTVTSSEAVAINKAQHIANIGTEILYGGYFNEGTEFMEARPFIPTSAFVTRRWGTLHKRLLEKPELVPNV